MKNIYLLIFILIFLYIICNGYIEKFSVGCQSIKKTPINISGSLTLPYINKCIYPIHNPGVILEKWYEGVIIMKKIVGHKDPDYIEGR